MPAIDQTVIALDTLPFHKQAATLLGGKVTVIGKK